MFDEMKNNIIVLGLGNPLMGDEGIGGFVIGKLLDINDPKFELMGAIAFGYPEKLGKSSRKSLESFVTWI